MYVYVPYGGKLWRVQTFMKCLQQKLLTEFPVKQKRRSWPPKLHEILLYCSCRMPDDGEKMVFCEQCNDWYHAKCL